MLRLITELSLENIESEGADMPKTTPKRKEQRSPELKSPRGPVPYVQINLFDEIS
jgi:hypothetical protein